MKRLRGTPFDVIGYTAERSMERQLIKDYRSLVSGIVECLDQTNLAAAIWLARAAYDIDGDGLVKDASAEEHPIEPENVVSCI
jgi:indolepyruvate ferredoxin oxidoreductase